MGRLGGTNGAARSRRARRPCTYLWVGMRRRQTSQLKKRETVILPLAVQAHIRVTMSPCPLFVSSPGQHSRLGSESSCASHHALRSHARPGALVCQSDLHRSHRSFRTDSLATPVPTLSSLRTRMPSWGPNDITPATLHRDVVSTLANVHAPWAHAHRVGEIRPRPVGALRTKRLSSSFPPLPSHLRAATALLSRMQCVGVPRVHTCLRVCVPRIGTAK